MRQHLIYGYLLLTLLPVLLYSQTSNSKSLKEQKIVGVWQAQTSQISSALQANFQFFKNGDFVFNLNGYDDLNPLRSISGKYILEKNLLKLKVVNLKCRIGFKISEPNLGFQSGPFVLDGGKIVTIKQNDSEYSEHEFEFLAGSKSIKIDEDQYFKISDDPKLPIK